jgi:hypothetical protein
MPAQYLVSASRVASPQLTSPLLFISLTSEYSGALLSYSVVVSYSDELVIIT